MKTLKMQTVFGLILTAIYLAAIVVMVANDWSGALAMKADAWGQFLSGVFAPPAFFWLVLGYFQQSEELRQNTAALQLQAEQLKHQVEETQALVQEASAQAKASAAQAESSARIVELQAEQALREARRAHPEFSELTMERGGTLLMSADTDVGVKFKNVGGRISHLKITAAPWSELRQAGYPEPCLEPGQYCPINLKFKARAPDNFTFDLTYTDAVGIRRVSQFSVSGDVVKLTTHAAPV